MSPRAQLVNFISQISLWGRPILFGVIESYNARYVDLCDLQYFRWDDIVQTFAQT